MDVAPAALWALLIPCSVAGAAYSLRAELRRLRAGPRPRRLAIVGRYVDAVMTSIGIGIGMGVALAFAALTVIIARVT